MQDFRIVPKAVPSLGVRDRTLSTDRNAAAFGIQTARVVHSRRLG